MSTLKCPYCDESLEFEIGDDALCPFCDSWMTDEAFDDEEEE